MAMIPQYATEKWTVEGTRASTTMAIAARITSAGGKVLSQSDESVSARVGSRLAFRFFGAAMPAGRGRIPMRLEINVKSETAHQTGVTATATSDPGWYLISTRRGTGAYAMALPQLLDYVRAS